MKQKLLTVVFILVVSIKSFCQFIDSDVAITTKGLSEEYASRFKSTENKAAFLNILNQFKTIHDIAPINIIVTFKEGSGDIAAEINYNQDKIFTNTEYSFHNEQWSGWGTGISLSLQSQIFAALSAYKKSVATKGYLIDKDILKFDSTVKCKKSNGDWVCFYAYNYFNSQGFFSYVFYDNARISIAGKVYETETSNTKMLHDIKFFMVGKTTGLDGQKTDAYYFCKFFSIATE